MSQQDKAGLKFCRIWPRKQNLKLAACTLCANFNFWIVKFLLVIKIQRAFLDMQQRYWKGQEMGELGINEKAKQQACEDDSQVGGCFCEFDSQDKSAFSFWV